MAKPTWITATPTSGSGDGSVNISASEHTGRVQRTGTITYKATGVTDVSQQVAQAGKTEFVNINNVSAPKGGGNVTITGKSNSSKLTFSLGTGDIVITLPSTYTAANASITNGADITGDPGASAEFDFSIVIAVPTNTTTGTLNKIVTLTAAGGQSASSTITQAAGDATLSVSPATVSLDASGTAVSVTVNSNTNWTVE